MYLGINWLAPSSCVIGKSTLFHRSQLQKCGGLRSFGKFMAEDNMIGQSLWDLGLRHKITPDLAHQNLGRMSSFDFFIRRSRWARIRKYTVVMATIVEPFSESIMLSIIFAISMMKLFEKKWISIELPFFPLFIAHLFVWFAQDAITFVVLLRASRQKRSISSFLRSWVLREITALPLYLWSISGCTVDWREATYRLLRGGTVELVSRPDSHLSPHFSISTGGIVDDEIKEFSNKPGCIPEAHSRVAPEGQKSSLISEELRESRKSTLPLSSGTKSEGLWKLASVSRKCFQRFLLLRKAPRRLKSNHSLGPKQDISPGANVISNSFLVSSITIEKGNQSKKNVIPESFPHDSYSSSSKRWHSSAVPDEYNQVSCSTFASNQTLKKIERMHAPPNFLSQFHFQATDINNSETTVQADGRFSEPRLGV
jgi:hypothetical protein